MDTRFFARTTFRYGDTFFYPGMEWKPTGGKNDRKIIGSRLVRAELVAQEGDANDEETSRNRVDVHIERNRGARKRGNRDRHSGLDTNKTDPGNQRA